MKNKTLFKYIRPDGYENETRDCTVITLSLVSNINYTQIHTAFKNAGRKNGKGVYSQKIIQKVCHSLNLEAKQVKRSGTINKLVSLYPKGRLYCLKRGHAFALINGIVYDVNKLNSHIKGAWLIKNKKVK